MSDKLSLSSELAALNSKRREFYDYLTEEEKKKFSAYLLLKYGANIEGQFELQEWYLRAINEYVNINFFALSKHPKLQWLTLTTVSPRFGNQRHYWLNSKKKSSDSSSKKVKFLLKLYPNHKIKDIELMTDLNTMQDLRDLAISLGMSDSDIKKELG